MKKHVLKTICYAITFLFFNNLKSQGFIWIKGPNTTGASGLYGNLGTVNNGNNPGARNSATFWKDASGNFWMFGGVGADFIGNQGKLADLWKYDQINNNWTWINGSNVISQVGVYGLMGVSNNSVHPGSRSSATTWQDAAGNVYLFGGNGYDAFAGLGHLNDLWKYNPTNNQWTWIGGSNVVSQAATYGTLGVSSPSNMPGARSSAITWVDNNGSVWLFGGLGHSNSSSVDFLNDLWKYNISTNQWTWMKGNNTGGQNGSYGAQGVSSSSNTPGARQSSRGWVDAAGNLLLFGGAGLDGSSSSPDYLNDLWKYDVSLNEWVWLKGSKFINQIGNYGNMGVASVSNTPGARLDAMTWKDTFGNYWLSGGQGYSASNVGKLNDVWIYNPITNNWTWIAGAGAPNLLGVYGNISTPNNSNIFGARVGCANWIDANNNLWLFGGNGNAQTTTSGNLSDTWKYTNCVINPITLTITTSNPLPCAKESVSLTVVGSNTYTWSTSPSSTMSAIYFNPTTTVTYTASTNNSNACIYSAAFTQSVNACTGFEVNFSNNSLFIYPNPSLGKIEVSLTNSSDCTFKIFNLSGQLVHEETINQNNQILDLKLNKGIYFYQAIQNNVLLDKGKIVID